MSANYAPFMLAVGDVARVVIVARRSPPTKKPPTSRASVWPMPGRTAPALGYAAGRTPRSGDARRRPAPIARGVGVTLAETANCFEPVIKLPALAPGDARLRTFATFSTSCFSYRGEYGKGTAKNQQRPAPGTLLVHPWFTPFCEQRIQNRYETGTD